ncbi:hypothetical protein FJY90_06045 [Candidatus Gottesmanbacteria bacterium]|nr:hypothetical protein [Candidatus Gottesmanbacteria bacterium]
MKPPVINNRQEFEETSDRLRRISRIFHQAADINPYRLLSVLDNLNLLHTLPAFFTRDTLDLTFTYKVLSLQDNVDAEIAQLLGFTAPNNLSHLVHNEILFDFIHQVMMNPNRFAGRLSAEDFSLLTSLLSQVKPGTRRLKEAIEGKGVILEEQEEEKELLFRLYPDTRNLADILEEYDITQRHDEEMIGRCLELAEDARVQGEAEPIACVLVNTATGERIEKSHNVKSGRVYEHAEKLALLEAETLWGIQDIENWELYLSIQPCPGCMELILQCFPHIKSIVFSAYSSQGQYSQQMADDNIIRASAKQDDTPSGFFETRDGVRTGEGTSFYRDRLGWTQMIKPFDPKRQTYWQRKFTALLFRGE